MNTPSLAEIVATPNAEPDALLHAIPPGGDTLLTWDYRPRRDALVALTTKARDAQWDPEDLPWHHSVDQERMALSEASIVGGFAAGADLSGTAFEHFTDGEWVGLAVEAQNWMLSQFLHGEQAALVCAAKLIQTVPWMEAKQYAASQAVDEARHVTVFARYLDEKLSGHYPVNAHFRTLLDDIIADDRWDVTYLGMQVLVEGLALAAFSVIRQLVDEPLLRELLRRVMTDEARHVAFGVLSLREVYDGLTVHEIEDRQRFAYEATIRMRDRFVAQEVFDRLGVPADQATRLVAQTPERVMFQRMLFAKIVPACAKLGLLDAGDGWLRRQFTDLGIIAWEHADVLD